MSQANIRKAFEKSLIALFTKPKIAFENAPFKPPTTEFYSCKLTAGEVQNPTFGDNYHREVGFFVVVVHGQVDKGSVAPAASAEQVKEHFKRGTTLLEGDTTVIVDKTPRIGSAYIDGSRYSIPVRISYFTNEF